MLRLICSMDYFFLIILNYLWDFLRKCICFCIWVILNLCIGDFIYVVGNLELSLVIDRGYCDNMIGKFD